MGTARGAKWAGQGTCARRSSSAGRVGSRAEFGITTRRRIVGGQLAAALFLAAVGGAALAVWHRTHQAAPAPMRVCQRPRAGPARHVPSARWHAGHAERREHPSVSRGLRDGVAARYCWRARRTSRSFTMSGGRSRCARGLWWPEISARRSRFVPIRRTLVRGWWFVRGVWMSGPFGGPGSRW